MSVARLVVVLGLGLMGVWGRPFQPMPNGPTLSVHVAATFCNTTGRVELTCGESAYNHMKNHVLIGTFPFKTLHFLDLTGVGYSCRTFLPDAEITLERCPIKPSCPDNMKCESPPDPSPKPPKPPSGARMSSSALGAVAGGGALCGLLPLFVLSVLYFRAKRRRAHRTPQQTPAAGHLNTNIGPRGGRAGARAFAAHKRRQQLRRVAGGSGSGRVQKRSSGRVSVKVLPPPPASFNAGIPRPPAQALGPIPFSLSPSPARASSSAGLPLPAPFCLSAFQSSDGKTYGGKAQKSSSTQRASPYTLRPRKK